MKTKKQKILYGSIVGITWLLIFGLIKHYNWGALPLVGVSFFFAWLFYLATDLDPFGVSDKDE